MKRYKVNYNYNNFSPGKQVQENSVKPNPEVAKASNAPDSKSVKAKLKSMKKTSSLVVCGPFFDMAKDKEIIENYSLEYDSIGTDWFCKSGIKTKFYFVRDQAHHSSMISHRNMETVNGFVDLMNERYEDSVLLISGLDNTEFDDYSTRWNWAKNPKKFKAKSYLFKEKRSVQYADMKKDFTKKCYRYSYDFFSVLQFSLMMGYGSVILAGFDLNTNKCFWCNDLRDIQIKRQLELNEVPEEYYAYKGMLNFYKNNFKKDVFTIDKNSKLLENRLAIYLK